MIRDIDRVLSEQWPELLKAEEAVGVADLNATCRSCAAEIIWITTERGKKSPCNARRLAITTKEGKTVTGYESHFGSCPGAANHRKGRP